MATAATRAEDAAPLMAVHAAPKYRHVHTGSSMGAPKAVLTAAAAAAIVAAVAAGGIP